METTRTVQERIRDVVMEELRQKYMPTAEELIEELNEESTNK